MCKGQQSIGKLSLHKRLPRDRGSFENATSLLLVSSFFKEWLDFFHNLIWKLAFIRLIFEVLPEFYHLKKNCDLVTFDSKMTSYWLRFKISTYS